MTRPPRHGPLLSCGLIVLLVVLAGSVAAQSPSSDATAAPGPQPLAAMPANQPGGYLATHWNTANAGFLIGAPPAQPSPPNGLAITFSTRDRALITWEDSHEETSYTLTRFDSASPTPSEGRLAANVASFADTALLCGQRYTYELTAINDRGVSNPDRLFVYPGLYPSCDGPDTYEPDDTAAQARPIVSGERQIHNMYPLNETDQVTFTLTEESQVILKIANRGRSNLYLNNEAGDRLDFASWPGETGVIKRDCRGNPLGAGTYSATAVAGYNNSSSADYALFLDIAACADLHWAFLPRIGR